MTVCVNVSGLSRVGCCCSQSIGRAARRLASLACASPGTGKAGSWKPTLDDDEDDWDPVTGDWKPLPEEEDADSDLEYDDEEEWEEDEDSEEDKEE